MKFAFLPNYFKRVGLWCFFGSFVSLLVLLFIHFPVSFKGFTLDQSVAYQTGVKIGTTLRSLIFDTHWWLPKIFTLLHLFGIAFYMLAKEKKEDDYIDVLRWESIRLSITICLVLNILCILFGHVLSAIAMLFVLFISYLITFHVKQSEPIEP